MLYIIKDFPFSIVDTCSHIITFIKKLLDINYNGVDEKIIEEFVEKVIVHKDYFEWKLNFMNETIKLEVDGKSRKDGFLLEHK